LVQRQHSMTVFRMDQAAGKSGIAMHSATV
jgi:hypothetical protein